MTTQARYRRWMNREAREGPIGFGAEFWRPVPNPTYQALVTLIGDPSHVMYFVTRGLIMEIIHAGGAVEHTVYRIETLMHDVQQKADAIVEDEHPPDDVPTWIADVSELSEVSWEYGNLLAWARGLEDRMERENGKLGASPRHEP